MTAGLSGKVLRRSVDSALEKLPALSEWIEPGVFTREGFPAFAEALVQLHRPTDPVDLSPDKPAYRRLAYDELLASQMALALARERARQKPGRVLGATVRCGPEPRPRCPSR